VAEQGPGDVRVLELGDGDLAGEGAVGLVEDVLGGDLDALAGVLAGEEEVEGGRGDDDLGVGVDLGVVELVDDVGDRLNGAVPGRSVLVGLFCWVSLCGGCFGKVFGIEERFGYS
jgi:hypothetical protein